MPNTPEDEGLHERWLHQDDEHVDARDVLDSHELAQYLEAERRGLVGPRPRKWK